MQGVRAAGWPELERPSLEIPMPTVMRGRCLSTVVTSPRNEDVPKRRLPRAGAEWPSAEPYICFHITCGFPGICLALGVIVWPEEGMHSRPPGFGRHSHLAGPKQTASVRSAHARPCRARSRGPSSHARVFQQHRPDYVVVSGAKVGGILANSNFPVEFCTTICASNSTGSTRRTKLELIE